jgi:transposase
MKTKILALTLISFIVGLSVRGNTPIKETGGNSTSTEQSKFQASINLLADDVVRFNVIKPDKDKVRLSVYTKGGIHLYSYILKKDNSARIGFDTQELSPGEYQYVVVRNKEEVLRKTIEKKKENK